MSPSNNSLNDVFLPGLNMVANVAPLEKEGHRRPSRPKEMVDPDEYNLSLTALDAVIKDFKFEARNEATTRLHVIDRIIFGLSVVFGDFSFKQWRGRVCQGKTRPGCEGH